MSRVVTYLTLMASDANDHVRMSRAMILMMDMILKGMSLGKCTIGNEARAHMDYALESPDLIPAGACEQDEIDTGDEENGMPGYCVSATQMVIERESLE